MCAVYRAGIAGLALTAATLTWTTGAWMQERLVNRVGPRSLVRAGFLLILVGAAVFAAAVSSGVPAAVGIFGWGIAGLGMGLAYAPLSLIVLGEATVGQEGAAASALQLSDVLGIALGTGVAGARVRQRRSPRGGSRRNDHHRRRRGQRRRLP